MNDIKSLMENFDYQEELESSKLAMDWISSRGNLLTSFINGSFVAAGTEDTIAQVSDPCNLDHTLASISTNPALLNNLSQAFLPPSSVHEVFHGINQHLSHSSNQKALQVLESLQNGKPISRVKANDFPALLDLVAYMATLPLPIDNYQPYGLVLLVADQGYGLSILGKALNILAAGNSLVLVPHPQSALTALFFAQLCSNAGLPSGAFNVVPCDLTKDTIAPLVSSLGQSLAKVVCCTQNTKLLFELRSRAHLPVEVEMAVRSSALVFESCDLDSAVYGIIEQFLTASACTYTSMGLKVLVQECLQDCFIAKLRHRWSKLRLGQSLDTNCDLAHICHAPPSFDEPDSQVFHINEETSTPFIITNVQTTSRFIRDPLFPFTGIAVMPFRTTKEAIQLAHNLAVPVFGPVAVWCEKLSRAMQIVRLLPNSTVWLNTQDMGYTGVFSSRVFSTLWTPMAIGGLEGVMRDSKPSWQSLPTVLEPLDPDQEVVRVTTVTPNDLTSLASYKLFYQGSLHIPSDQTTVCQPFSGENLPFAYLPVASDKDVENCFNAAKQAQLKWAAMKPQKQALAMLRLSKAIQNSSLVDRLSRLGRIDEAQGALMAASKLLRTWTQRLLEDPQGMSWKFSEEECTVLSYAEPVGLILIFCPDHSPFRYLCSLVAPAIARGNSVVLVPSFANPYPALQLCEAFSQLPPGLVNMLTGDPARMAKLCRWPQVDAVWYHCTPWHSLLDTSHTRAAWISPQSGLRDWSVCHKDFEELVSQHSTRPKNIWIPSGEIFAN